MKKKAESTIMECPLVANDTLDFGATILLACELTANPSLTFVLFFFVLALCFSLLNFSLPLALTIFLLMVAFSFCSQNKLRSRFLPVSLFILSHESSPLSADSEVRTGFFSIYSALFRKDVGGSYHMKSFTNTDNGTS